VKIFDAIIIGMDETDLSAFGINIEAEKGIRIEGTNPNTGFDVRPAALSALEQSRQQYLQWIKGIKPPTGEGDPSHRRDLTPNVHSVLYLLRNVELTKLSGDQAIGNLMENLEKVPLSTAIASRIGHRPNAITFEGTDLSSGHVTNALDIMLEKSGSVYLKSNRSFRGEGVYQILKENNQYRVVDAGGRTIVVSDLSSYQLPLGINEKDVFIAEEAIPIARTQQGRTWEMRFLPPLDVSYCKVGGENNVVNNIAQGGQVQQASDVLQDVLKVKNPDATPEKLSADVENFIKTASQLATQVKGLTDNFQMELAKAILKPDDLKEPAKYDELIKTCFSGTFLCVDITAVWDEKDKLVPQIIEAQPSAGISLKQQRRDPNNPLLSISISSDLYEAALLSLIEKVVLLKQELK